MNVIQVNFQILNPFSNTFKMIRFYEKDFLSKNVLLTLETLKSNVIIYFKVTLSKGRGKCGFSVNLGLFGYEIGSSVIVYKDGFNKSFL